MQNGSETGYSISRPGLDRVIVEYFPDASDNTAHATATCANKVCWWEAIDFKRKFARDCDRKAEHIGMIKTVLFSYLSKGQEQYLLASTLPETKVDRDELRIELGLSAEETQSITHRLGDASIEKITGRKRGAVSPLLDSEYLTGISAVYFTRDLIDDAAFSPEKLYDVPRSLTVSEFWNAASLFTSLQQKSSKYKTAGNFEDECEMIDLKLKKADPAKAGYGLLFGGSIVKYRGQEFQVTNPPMEKEGVSRRRKQLLCTAFPIFRGEKGNISYERDQEHQKMKKQLFLPLTYGLLEKLLPPSE